MYLTVNVSKNEPTLAQLLPDSIDNTTNKVCVVRNLVQYLQYQSNFQVI